MMMPCTITTGTAGHGRHSVALTACVPADEGKMVALNSWGAQQTYMDVTPSNFVLAMTFDPVIVKVHAGASEEEAPLPREIYTGRDGEFDGRSREEGLRRERSTALRAQAEEERRKRAAAERAAEAEKKVAEDAQAQLAALLVRVAQLEGGGGEGPIAVRR